MIVSPGFIKIFSHNIKKIRTGQKKSIVQKNKDWVRPELYSVKRYFHFCSLRETFFGDIIYRMFLFNWLG